MILKHRYKKSDNFSFFYRTHWLDTYCRYKTVRSLVEKYFPLLSMLLSRGPLRKKLEKLSKFLRTTMFPSYHGKFFKKNQNKENGGRRRKKNRWTKVSVASTLHEASYEYTPKMVNILATICDTPLVQMEGVGGWV